MPDTPNPTETELLISRAFQKRAEVARLIGELAIDQAAIIAMGKGRHSGTEAAHVVTVVAAVPGKVGEVSYALSPDNQERAHHLVGDGDKFSKLFRRVVSYLPVEGFAAVAHALLTPAKERDLVQLCLVPGKQISGKSAYILWPK